jgi:hypothetical protein
VIAASQVAPNVQSAATANQFRGRETSGGAGAASGSTPIVYPSEVSNRVGVLVKTGIGDAAGDDPGNEKGRKDEA